MSEPRDYPARRRFAEELDRNFSVVASAVPAKLTRLPSVSRTSRGPETPSIFCQSSS